MSARNTYHPALPLAYFLGILPKDIQKELPRTTVYDWGQKDVATLYGNEWFQKHQSEFEILTLSFENRELKQTIKALIKIIALKNIMTKYAKEIKSKIGHSAEVVQGHIRILRGQYGLGQILKHLHVPYREYYQMRKPRICAKSSALLCLIKHPHQLISQEINIIKQYCAKPEYLHWSLATLYHKIRKDQMAYFSIATFYKYIRILKLSRKSAKHRRKNHTIGIRATKPFEIIQVDTTIYRLIDNTKVYIYLAIDNYSRGILSCRVTLDMNSRYVMENIKDVYDKYLHNRCENSQLISDDGSENYGSVSEYLATLSDPKYNHLIAQKDIIPSNSMIEHVNKRLKYDFLYRKPTHTFQEVIDLVDSGVVDHNTRPHSVNNGLSVNEILFEDKQPHMVNYTKETELAQINRIKQNQSATCCQNTKIE